MLGFDDVWKGQITFAKSILDKYGFKASFFVVCNYVNSGSIRRMNWQDMATLQKDGMDIESHTMTHPHLNTLNQNGTGLGLFISRSIVEGHGGRIWAVNNNKVIEGQRGSYVLLYFTHSQ